MAHPVVAQSNVYWNFGTATGQDTPTSGVPAGAVVSAVSQGNNNGTTTLLTTTSASTGYTGASGAFNAGASARTGALNIGASGSAYFEFTVTPDAGKGFTVTSISFGSRSTGTGPTAYALRSSADAFTSDLATGTMTANSSWALQTAAVPATQRTTAITYRLYGFNGTGSATASTANWRIDDLTVVVTVADLNPNAPLITDFVPSAGVVGTSVAISGTNFTGVTSVTFGSISAPIVSSSVTNIQTTVPAGATNAPITVATPNGSATSAQSFLILDGSGTATVQNGTAPYAGRNIFARNASNQTLQVVFTPPAAGPIAGLQITVPSAFGAPASSNVVVTGGGGSPAVSVVGQTVTISNLAATAAFTNSISGLTAPDTSTPATNAGSYQVAVQSRGSGGTFAAIAAQPSALVSVPISNVRNISGNANYIPALISNLVVVEGIANVARLQTNRGVSAAIQDPSWGVAVDSSLTGASSVSSNLTRGNSYLALGTVTQFQGLVQVNVTNATNLINLGPGVDPSPVVATVPEFTNPPTAYTFQSRVVRIENLTYVPGAAVWTTNTNATFVDQSGNTLTVHIAPASTATNPPPTNQLVTVVGVGGQSDTNAAPFDTGWRLQPRDTADIIVGASISVNPTSISNLTATQGNFGPSTNFTVNASNLSNNITVTANDAANFAISTNNTDFTNTLSLPTNSSGAVTNASVFVRLTGAAPDGAKSNTVTLASDATVTNVIVTGTVSPPPTPTITANPATITNLTATQGTPGAATSFTAGGANLTGNITVSATDAVNFAISTNSASGFTSSLVLTSSGGSVASTPVFVRLTAASQGTFNSSVSLFGGGASSTNVVVGGTVSAPPVPTLTATPTNIVDLQSIEGNPSGTPYSSYSLQGTAITNNVSIDAQPGLEVSFANTGSGFSSSLAITTPPPAGSLSSNVFVRIASSAPVGAFTNFITNSTIGGASNTIVRVTGSVSPSNTPTIIVNPSVLPEIVANVGQASTNQSFSVSGNDLASAVTVSAPAGFQISTNGNDWTSTVTLNPGLPFAVAAVDSATNYTSATWTNGANGGTGFQAWQISVNNNPPAWFAGNFIGDPSFAGITGMSAQSFGLFANPAASLASVSASRSFAAGPLQTNQTLSFQWAVNFDTGSTNYKGFRLLSGATPVLEVGQNGFPGDLRLIAGSTTNTNLGIAYGTGPMTWSFAMTNTTTLRVTSTARTNPSVVAFATNLTVATAPDSFVWFAGAMTNANTDQRQPYFNNPQIITTTGAGSVIAPTTIYVRLANTSLVGTFAGQVDVTGGGAAPNQVQVSGRVVVPPPTLAISPTTLSNFTTVLPSPSTNQSFTVEGANLTANVTITPPAGWQVSATNANNFTNVAITLGTNPAGVVSNTPVFVRLAGTNAAATNYPASLLSVVSGTISTNVTLSGSVTVPVPTILLSTNALSGLITTQGAPSSITNFTVSGTGLSTNITITPPAGWQVAVTDSLIFTASPTNIPTNPAGIVSNTVVYVRLAGTNTALTNVPYVNVPLGVGSGSTNTSVLLSGQVNAQPSLSLVVPTPMPDNTDPIPARVERPSTATNQAVTVTLTANAPTVPGSTILTVPPTVTIPAGTNSVQFNMKTLQVSGSLAFIVSARASGYRSASTNVLVSNAALRAASLGPEGYRQTFQSFTNWSSLPYGWSSAYAVPTVRLDQDNIPIIEYRARAITTNEYTPWGTLANYMKNSYQLDTNYGLVNVFGVQFPNVESTEALLDGDQSLQTLTVRNDLGTAISGVRITYTGRTTRSAADPTNPATKNPIYTVSVTAGTNEVIDGALSYGTEQGDGIFKSNQISGLNIPAFGTFTIGWNAFQQREVGVAKQIGIGDVTVQALRPFLNIFPLSGIGDFTTLQGTPSSPPQEFWVYGENLFRTNNAGAPLSLVVSMTNTNSVLPVGYQISQDGVNFSNSPVSLPIPANGIILTNLYVRMSGASPGIIAGTFRVDGGGPQTNGLIEAPVSGTVFSNGPSAQVLYSSTTPLTDFSTIVSVRSPARILYVSAVNIGANPVTVTAPDGFEVSLNSQNNYGRTALLNTAVGGVLSPTPVYLRLTGDQEGPVSGRLSLTCPGVAPQVVDVGGMVGPEQPVINVSPSLLPIFQAAVGETSAPKSFTVGGSYLLTNISIAPPSGFQISTNSTNGFTGGSINLAPVAGTVASTNIFVRFFPTTPGEFSGDVTLSSSNAQTKLVAVTGAVDPVPIIRTSPGQLDGFQGRTGLRTCRQPIQITGQRLRAPGISVTFNSLDWELFTDATSTTPVGSPYVIPIGPGDTATTTLYVGVSPNAQARTSFTDDWLTLSNGPTLVDVPLSGSVCPGPSVSVTPTSISGLEAVQSCDNSQWTNFTVSGTNLFGDIVLTNISPGLEIATDTNTPTSSSITLAATFIPPGVVTASDSGANYGSGWTNGANRGQGFLPWSISLGQGTGAAGNFIGAPTNAGIGGMATNSFGLFANPSGSNSFVTVQRGLSNNLAVGQTLSFQWGINFDSGITGNKGFSLFAGTNELINVNNAGNSDITLNGTNVGFGYGTNAMTWSFTRTASNTLTVTANDRDGSGTYSNTLSVTDGAVSAVRFYASALQAGDQHQPYFNNLNVATGSGNCGGYAVAPTNIFVRISSNAVVANPFVGTVTAQSRVFDPTLCLTNSSTLVSAAVTINGAVRPLPQLSATPTNLTFYPIQGYVSEAQAVRVTGTNLLTNVQVNPPAGFRVSTNQAGPFSSSLVLTNTGAVFDRTVHVRADSNAAYGDISGLLTFDTRCARASVTIDGRVVRPTENAAFIMSIYRMLLYRDATPAEVAFYSGLLGGGSGGVASNAQKAGVIMRIMGFESTASPFPWPTAYNLNNEYVRSASVLFSFYARLGLVPELSQNQTLIRSFVETVRNNPLSPGLPCGPLDLAGAPWTATYALAQAFEDFVTSPFFLNSNQAGMLTYTLNPDRSFVYNWLLAKFVDTNSGAAFSGPLAEATFFMLQGPDFGMTFATANPFAQGAGIALYSVFSQAALRAQPIEFGDGYNDPYWRPWQLALNQAALNFQLWGSWDGLGLPLNTTNVSTLLRAPVLSGAGSLSATVGQAFSYQVSRANPASPINQAPNIFFSASGLPPGLSIDSFGNITGTPTAAGNFTATVTAQNISGTSTPVTLQFTVTGTQAQNWMSATYGSANTNPLYSYRTNDTDGDGYDTATEYAFGSDPNRPNPSVSTSSNLSASVMRIFWNGLTNQTYTVQVSTNLTGSPAWTNRPGAVVTTNGSVFSTNGASYRPFRTDVTNSGASNEFYRIWTDFTQQQLQ